MDDFMPNISVQKDPNRIPAKPKQAGTHCVMADLHWLILFCLFCSETLFASAYYVPDKFVLWHILY